MAKTKLDPSDFDFIKIQIEDALREIPRSAIDPIAGVVVDKMKDLISKGISPIASVGRFAEYKGAAVSRGKGTKKGYPYTVQKKYPEKKPRPVNLYLSGDMLADLDAKVVKTEDGYDIVPEYTTELSKKKEQGHREGANGQAIRPTIAISGEEYSQAVLTDVTEIYKLVVDDALKKSLS